MSVVVEVVIKVVEVVVMVVEVVMVAGGPQCHTACRFSPEPPLRGHCPQEPTAPVKIAVPTYDDYTVLPVMPQRTRRLPSISTRWMAPAIPAQKHLHMHFLLY